MEDVVEFKMNEKEQRLINFVNKAYQANDSKAYGHAVNIVANVYRDYPNVLKGYFNHTNSDLATVAVCAYRYIHGDIEDKELMQFYVREIGPIANVVAQVFQKEAIRSEANRLKSLKASNSVTRPGGINGEYAKVSEI